MKALLTECWKVKNKCVILSWWLLWVWVWIQAQVMFTCANFKGPELFAFYSNALSFFEANEKFTEKWKKGKLQLLIKSLNYNQKKTQKSSEKDEKIKRN